MAAGSRPSGVRSTPAASTPRPASTAPCGCRSPRAPVRSWASGRRSMIGRKPARLPGDRHTSRPMTQHLWSGRFDSAPDPAAFDFGLSFAFDRRLFEDDITGSLAWADALADAGVLARPDADLI